jgi:hypothetical protein
VLGSGFDFGKKVVSFGKPLMPTGNLEEDLIILNKHFIGVLGKIPEKGFKV